MKRLVKLYYVRTYSDGSIEISDGDKTVKVGHCISMYVADGEVPKMRIRHVPISIERPEEEI